MDKRKFRMILDRLVDFTAGCRESMHDPEDQGISARVVGYTLNNSFGNRIMGGFQEIVVVLLREDKLEPELVNLADLIALARKANLE